MVERFTLPLILFSLMFIVIHISASPVTYCLPENGSLLFGAYTPAAAPSSFPVLTEQSIHDFSESAGKNPAILVYDDEWSENLQFPNAMADLIRNNGATPYIRLMMRSSTSDYEAEPLYTFDNIASGKFDTSLKQWALDARSFGTPLIVEYGTEVNEWWYPWNGYWNGGEKGPESFIRAYRHIIDLMNAEGADNIIWVYHISPDSLPDEPWNTPGAYYPGDDYIDWIGLSVRGATSPYATQALAFTDQMDRVYSNLSSFAPGKPVILAEMGTDMRNQVINPVTWLSEAFSSLTPSTWPGLIGVVWWNDAWKNDDDTLHDTSFTISDNKQVLSLFRTHVAENPSFISTNPC